MLIGGTSGIQFDLDSQRLTVIDSPPGLHDSVQIIHSEDGGVAFATLSGPWNTPRFRIWEREVNSYGVARWELRKTVELQKILGLRFKIDTELSSIVGYAEDINAIFLWVHSSVYMVQIESMQSKELFQSDRLHIYHPFTSFYIQGMESSLRRK
ncbi:uncharacterized protein LOC124660081 [Lolium rigidum]|uniref:uncharacterized protein LOC124660081 n=1 Tax=Lolium rigidum TaxID=89674 RepID=UPI001F5C62B0|nr:uncharacterized protein LOC124660081 [Lolium rigidum]